MRLQTTLQITESSLGEFLSEPQTALLTFAELAEIYYRVPDDCQQGKSSELHPAEQPERLLPRFAD